MTNNKKEKKETFSDRFDERIGNAKTVFQYLNESERFPTSTSSLKPHESWASLKLTSETIVEIYTLLEEIMKDTQRNYGIGDEIGGEKWHADLLARMQQSDEYGFPKVIEEDTYKNLHDIKNFRHYVRYHSSLELNAKKVIKNFNILAEALPLFEFDFRWFMHQADLGLKQSLTQSVEFQERSSNLITFNQTPEKTAYETKFERDSPQNDKPEDEPPNYLMPGP